MTPVRRVLTLVTKILQQLANGLPFKNEEAMARFNTFIIAHSERMRKFLLSAIQVKDPYRVPPNARGFPISLSLKGIIDIMLRHVPALMERLREAKDPYVGKFYILSYRYVMSLSKAMLGTTDPRIDQKMLRAAATRAVGGARAV